MIIYTCKISGTTDPRKAYEPIEDIIIESAYPIPHNRLRAEVIKLANKKYVSFGHMTFEETII